MAALDIRGHRGRPVPNQFIRGNGDALGILLPGLGYNCDMPALYYAQNIFEHLGADILRVEYDYGTRADFQAASAGDQAIWIEEDVTAAHETVLAQGTYRRVAIVAKSMGTKALGNLVGAGKLDEDATRLIWLTPLLRDPLLYEQILACRSRSLFVIGTRDPHYDPDRISKLPSSEEHSWLVVEGVDHGFDVLDDVASSIDALSRIVEAMAAFLVTPP